MVNPGLLNLAVKEARKSTFRQKMGAVIFSKKIILSSGHNFPERAARKLHPRYSRYPNSVHAETDAILKAKRPLKGTSILVVRINIFDKLGLAMPCDHCLEYIGAVGIRKVYYTVNSSLEDPLFRCLILK